MPIHHPGEAEGGGGLGHASCNVCGMSGESPKATEIKIGCDKAQQGCGDQASSHGGGGTGSLYLQAPPSGSAGPGGVRSQRQPLHSHRSPRACFLSNDPASPQLPPCGNRNCSYLSRGRRPEPQLAVIKHPDRARDGGDINSQESMAHETQPPRQRDSNLGRPWG